MSGEQKTIPYFMAGPSITSLEEEYVLDALRNGWYENAYKYVELFEKEFAAYHDRKFALMTPNCSTAIHLLLAGLGISAGDEVIVPDCTWIGSTAFISHLGARPVFADIDPIHWCIDIASVERAITPKTKAIIAVDLYGNMPDMHVLQKLADEKGLFLIEDAAEALGSVLNGVKAGKFGVGSVFSFHRTKTIATGEGGVLLLDDEKLYERCSVLRDHGRKKGGALYYNYEVAYKYMPFNLQAALGYAQFKRIEELVQMKRSIYQGYKELLSDIPDLYFNPEPEGGRNGVWCTALVFGESHGITKQEVMDEFTRRGLGSRPFFYPLSSLPAYEGNRPIYEPRNPVAYSVSNRGINFSCALNLTKDQIALQCDVVREFIKSRGVYKV